MRIHTASSSSANQGYHSTLINGNIELDSEVNGKEFSANNKKSLGEKNVGNKVTTGSWQAYEQYIKFSSVSGQGVYRVWQDGKLVFEDLDTATLRSSSSISDLIYLFTYWNNGAPKTQSAYVDDIIVTNERPDTLDANGNPYVGLGDFKSVVAPRPPLWN